MRTRRAITDNAGQLGTVYERLRKRSLRAVGRHRDRMSAPDNTFSFWWKMDHEAYVAGVRDALNAVATTTLAGNPPKQTGGC